MHRTILPRHGLVLALAAFICVCEGCANLGYQLGAVVGELDYIGSAVPVDQAVSSDSTLTDDQRSKLEFVLRAKDFGANVVGLKVGNSWQRFVDTHGQPVAWNLSASKKDSFTPYVWNLLIGPFPYLGYFNKDEAIKERDRLLNLAYDTVMYPVDAFSTLGTLPDPISSALLERSLPSLADTVLHELTHNTISKLNDANFNETLAVFVGRTAGVQFLEQEFGADSDIVHQAKEVYEDSDRLNAFLQTMVVDLTALYDSDLSSEEKIAQRVTIIQADQQHFTTDILPLMHDQQGYGAYSTFPINNAFLLLNVRYNDSSDVFQKVFDLAGQDWGQALKIFAHAASNNDPLGYMRGIIAAGG